MRFHRLTSIALTLLLTCRAFGADISVRDAGAKGDGQTDDTAAFQKALDDAGKTGDRVTVPGGRYAIRGHLNIPESVTLAGTFEAPARTQFTTGLLEKEKGSILLAYEGKGDEKAEPFITLNRASHLRGMIVFYPEQTDDVIAYPWCVRGVGDNCTITATLLINPYKAVDFGTQPAGRHYINGLYSQALKTGIFVDKCFDVGRIENVHFWPFWQDTPKLQAYMRKNATAFIIARTDWEYMSNCFNIWYAVGYHFIANADGPGNAVLANCGSDIGPLSVKIDAVQPHAGVSFTNGQFMAGVEVGEKNAGPVKFNGCGFWGVGDTDTHVRIRGSGTVTLNACHFTAWGQKEKTSPCIAAESGGLIVNASEFLDKDAEKTHIEIGQKVQSAVIVANRFRSPAKIANHSAGDVQIGLNSSPKSRD
jgi:hypothetical protein